MTESISIGASHYTDLIRLRLADELKKFEGRGLKFKIEEKPAGKYTFLCCSVNFPSYYQERREEYNAWFRNQVADILSDLIVCKWQKIMLGDIIRENYYYFGEEERKTIFSNALHYLDTFNGEDAVSRVRKKNGINRKISDFLGVCNQIVIDGFIRFRLKEYTRDLKEAADKAVDDFLIEREYKEFIDLLKYFVDIQDTRTEVVNVVVRPNGVFKLYDEEKKVINSSFLDDFMTDMLEGEINYEDLLISALITLAPKEVVLHTGKNELPASLHDTIRSIFLHKIIICQGCDLCTANNK